VARLLGKASWPIFFDFVIFVLVPRGATLTGFGLSVAGARAPCPRQVWRLRPDECRAPPAPGAERRLQRARGGLGDSRRLAVVRAEALRDRPLEYEGQAAVHPSTLEQICTALIDRMRRCSRCGGFGEDADGGKQLGGIGGHRPGRQSGAPHVALGGAGPAEPGRGEGARS
jgi:hypothetical protein